MSHPEPNTSSFLPCPTRVRAGRIASAVERLVFCPLYQQCLDVAAKNGWEDFTCRRCPLAREQATAPSAAALATHQPKG
ncbi:MAG TPA: hypothetical protein VND93_25435 [Myxococcales bacterium]|jgi:hypothetical protein|nr:hypothetical protein [Myxococcales bacterium]